MVIIKGETFPPSLEFVRKVTNKLLFLPNNKREKT